MYHEKRMSIKELRKTVPREVFKEVRTLDKTYWAYTQVLEVTSW
jgi:hypothetical protein